MIPEDCPKATYQKGMKQPRDYGMPECSWGCYLPGDEPGWICEDPCDDWECELSTKNY